MDNFYTIVIFVAVVALILVLTYVGIVMTYGEGTTAYPPQSTTCPDHWVIDEEKNCIIPGSDDKNTGTMYERGLLSDSVKGSTPGIDTDKNVINFSHEDWKASGQEICAKKEWSNKHGVVWDSVSNYNDC